MYQNQLLFDFVFKFLQQQKLGDFFAFEKQSQVSFVILKDWNGPDESLIRKCLFYLHFNLFILCGYKWILSMISSDSGMRYGGNKLLLIINYFF